MWEWAQAARVLLERKHLPPLFHRRRCRYRLRWPATESPSLLASGRRPRRSLHLMSVHVTPSLDRCHCQRAATTPPSGSNTMAVSRTPTRATPSSDNSTVGRLVDVANVYRHFYLGRGPFGVSNLHDDHIGIAFRLMVERPVDSRTYLTREWVYMELVSVQTGQ